MVDTNRCDIPADAEPATPLRCEVCDFVGAPGEVEAMLEDGEEGTYVVLCVDSAECHARFHRLREQWEAENASAAPLTVEKQAEIPF